jgi:hypothetical protein
MKFLKGGEKQNEFIGEEPRSRGLTKRVIRLKRVYNIPKNIFEKRKLEDMGSHIFKEGSFEIASGRKLTTSHFIRIQKL